jgi:hypothetical protein
MRHMIALAAVVAVAALTVPASAQQGSGKFCLKGPGTAMKCSYQTMAACDQAKKGGQSCIQNSGATTGAGSPTTKQK